MFDEFKTIHIVPKVIKDFYDNCDITVDSIARKYTYIPGHTAPIFVREMIREIGNQHRIEDVTFTIFESTGNVSDITLVMDDYTDGYVMFWSEENMKIKSIKMYPEGIVTKVHDAKSSKWVKINGQKLHADNCKYVIMIEYHLVDRNIDILDTVSKLADLIFKDKGENEYEGF